MNIDQQDIETLVKWIKLEYCLNPDELEEKILELLCLDMVGKYPNQLPDVYIRSIKTQLIRYGLL